MTTDSPLVSIVTPSYNKGPFIEETILSVLNQDYGNIQYIIIDGGSTDGTQEILKKYSERIHYWVSEPDRGQSDAINKGWKRARGEIFAYLNADDTYTNDAISTAVNYFKEHPDTGMIYGNGLLTDEVGHPICTYKTGDFSMKDLICCRDHIFQPAVFFRKEVYNTIGGIDEKLHLAMDLDYWIRIGLSFKIQYIPHLMATAKVYPDVKSVSLMHRYVKEYELILGKVFSNPQLSPNVAGWKNEAYNYIYVKGGLDDIHLYKIREGFTYLWIAFRMDPIATVITGTKLLKAFFSKSH